LSALVHHLPYMVSGAYLDKLLEISNLSAEADLDGAADESRLDCMRLAAKQIDAKSIFGALDRDWERAAGMGTFVSGHPMTLLGQPANLSIGPARISRNS